MKSEVIGELGEVIISRTLQMTAHTSEKWEELAKAFDRYKMGDWGDLHRYDKQMNDAAVQNTGIGPILALYKLSFGEVYILTEQDRSCTVLMLPVDYYRISAVNKR